MNALSFVTLACVAALASAHGWAGHDDGQWRGEGLAESQDHGQYDHGYGGYGLGAGLYAGAHYGGLHAYGPAPLSHEGVVIDTPDVAHAKAAHHSAVSQIASHGAVHGAETPGVGVHGAGLHGAGAYGAGIYGAGLFGAGHGSHGLHAYGPAPLSHEGVVVDTPEVAHAKIAHHSAVSRIAAHGAVHGAETPGVGVHGAAGYGIGIHGYGGPSVYGGHGVYAHGGAPIGHDGRVVDTPEVAHAKAAHFAAKAAASHGAHHYGAHGLW